VIIITSSWQRMLSFDHQCTFPSGNGWVICNKKIHHVPSFTVEFV
jgi:hypothetical protein